MVQFCPSPGLEGPRRAKRPIQEGQPGFAGLKPQSTDFAADKTCVVSAEKTPALSRAQTSVRHLNQIAPPRVWLMRLNIWCFFAAARNSLPPDTTGVTPAETTHVLPSTKRVSTDAECHDDGNAY